MLWARFNRRCLYLLRGPCYEHLSQYSSARYVVGKQNGIDVEAELQNKCEEYHNRLDFFLVPPGSPVHDVIVPQLDTCKDIFRRITLSSQSNNALPSRLCLNSGDRRNCVFRLGFTPY